MGSNLVQADRYIRVLIGISLLLNIIILKPGIVGTIVLLVFGLFFLYSAYSGFCWLYSLLKITPKDQSNNGENIS